MRWYWIFLLTVYLSACSALTEEPGSGTDQPTPVVKAQLTARPTATGTQLEVLGTAPELENEVWLNVDRPLRLAGLRDRVVLLDMWTFGCVNCRNVISSLREWHTKYGEQGLVVIGDHYPEFSFEHDLENLIDAIRRLDIPYAVAQDNQGLTWRAYNNRYWPTLCLIDKKGRIRFLHIGEGGYGEIEAVIQELLAE